ncbi:fatty acid-binding protein-like isoform X2 [Diorhabda sublineata]|uniref:fatty acid-binding protein-like isoform X2 n=1 Tax=Diorhabda sublineata TaxID=1163346 RepID=UPI0024E08687|nr:fatty acid-binding protein-like isoform X2 [Diorhabda sublineata]XP_056648103.1 fatty acid-binding protein-like isoform X2 [Diorhabda sublineata]
MVKFEGKYTFERGENLDAYFKDIGVPYIPRKMMCSSSPTLEIAKQNDQWCITVVTLFRTVTSKFKLGESYEENMPGGTLKNVTTLEGDKLITDSVGPEDIKTKREYEFSEDGCVIIYSNEKSSHVAKRYFTRA